MSSHVYTKTDFVASQFGWETTLPFVYAFTSASEITLFFSRPLTPEELLVLDQEVADHVPTYQTKPTFRDSKRIMVDNSEYRLITTLSSNGLTTLKILSRIEGGTFSLKVINVTKKEVVAEGTFNNSELRYNELDLHECHGCILELHAKNNSPFKAYIEELIGY